MQSPSSCIKCFRGADKEAQDVDHYTPLLTAAEFGRTDGFKLLLQPPYNASINVRNKDGRGVVYLATESNHPEIVEVCLQS